MTNVDTQSLAPDPAEQCPKDILLVFLVPYKPIIWAVSIMTYKTVTQSTLFPNQLNHSDLSLDSNSWNSTETPGLYGSEEYFITSSFKPPTSA